MDKLIKVIFVSIGFSAFLGACINNSEQVEESPVVEIKAPEVEEILDAETTETAVVEELSESPTSELTSTSDPI